MPAWLDTALRDSAYFMPHGHCYLWLPGILWMHVGSDLLIGAAYVGISLLLWGLVRRLRLPFSPVFIAFGLFIGLCGGTHFMEIWTTWYPDYVAAGLLKAATAVASVATAIGLVYVKPQIEAVVQAARLSEERRVKLEVAHSELESLFNRVRQLDAMRTQFFANVSHELRTPLTLILAPAEQMLADPRLDETQRRRVGTIHSNGLVLLRHVNDLLDVARLEAGQARLQLSTQDSGAWLRRIAAQFQGVAEQRGLRLDVEVAGGVPATFDADKIERVVVNLLANALRFTPSGGTVRLSSVATADGLDITVADSGPGIPADQREAVFERFRQVDDGDGTRGGTGLGLSIVREFVALHEGRVALDDAPEGGARFRVHLPARRAEGELRGADGFAATALAAALQELQPTDADPRPVEPTPDVPPRPRVLVAEDNASMRELLVATLRPRFEVDTVEDGEAALAAVHASPPDLLITDLMMPRMPGDALLRAIRADRDLDALPVLVLTARGDDAVRVALLRDGAQDFVGKPFGAAELLARVSNLVEAKRAGDVLRGELATLSTDLADLALRVSAKNRQLQAAVQAAEGARLEAERASSAKGYFLGMISHEMRSPLTTLALNLQLLARDPAFPEALRTRLDRLTRATQQMTTLIEGLLHRARIESGRLDAKLGDVDVEPLAHEVIAACHDEAPPGLTTRLEVDAPLAPLHTDSDLLRLSIGNLLSNAYKFTPEGEVVLRLASSDGWHRIEVRDTGIGIEPQDLDRIFEPFEQVEALRRKSVPGVGLGLALVKQMVEALGGRIEVESVRGAGSTFRMLLPSRGPA
ncbi:ATP-binding protein [Lysobacter xanthus]